jgi:hypothetical protein
MLIVDFTIETLTYSDCKRPDRKISACDERFTAQKGGNGREKKTITKP